MTSQLTLPPFQGSRNGNVLGRPPTPSKVKLDTGLSLWRGIVAEEYLTDLKPWNKAYKVFKEMEDDVVIGALYESIKAPLMDARFTVESASDETADLEAAEFLKVNTIESQSYSWLDHVDESLDFLSFGFSLAEKVLEKSPDGFLHISDLMPIGQDTLLRWGEKTDEHGRVTEFVQQVVTDSRLPQERSAPIDKLLHFTFRSKKRDPMGRSLSRNLYRSWYFKKNLEVLESIGAERDVGNVPVAILGEGYYAPEDITIIRDALDGLRIDETASLLVPHGTEVKPFGSGGKVYDIRTMIRDYQHLIRQRFFMDFISFGSEQVGTQALAKEVTGFFSLALGSVQRQMIEVWNRQLVPWLFRWNYSKFTGIEELPKLRWAKPGKINVQSLAQGIQGLLSVGAIHWTPELEHHLRELYELPSITNKEIDALVAKQEAEQQAALESQGQVTDIDAAKGKTQSRRPQDRPPTRTGQISNGTQRTVS